nr:MAG: ORF1 [Torque teno midi virus]
MPYFWRYPAWRRRYTRAWRRRRRPARKPTRRRARRLVSRRRNYYTYRKRKRRVRRRRLRKKRAINLIQWQPENIRKCTIVGYQPLIACGNGKQSFNYNQHTLDLCMKNESYGGGFSILLFTLQYLYQQWILFNNIWTTGNNGYDLVRYTGVTFWFFRHPFASFIVNYAIAPPFTVDRSTYTNCNPLRMLLQKHKILIPSLSRKPKGKPWIKKKIRVPKLLMNKWYFQADFCDTPLVLLKASMIGLSTPYLKYSNDNNCVGLYCLNPDIFDSAGWFATEYSLRKNIHLYIKNKQATETDQRFSLKELTKFEPSADGIFFWRYLNGDIPVAEFPTPQTSPVTKEQFEKNIVSLVVEYRYQPARDTGEGNTIFLESVLSKTIDIPTNKNYKYDNLPLWLLMFGWIDWCSKFFKGDNIYDNYTLCVKSKYLHPIDHPEPASTLLVPISSYFYKGQNEFNYPLLDYEKTHWAPTIRHQQTVINDFCMAGAYSSLPSGKSADLAIKYKFHLKWGGTVVHSQTINDPENQPVYPMPTEELQRLQVKDPSTQDSQSEYHRWHYRRGFLTKKAIKRALKDSETSSISSTDSEAETTKRRRLGEPTLSHPRDSISSKVQEVCEEATCQASQTQEEKLLKLKLRNQRLQQLIIGSLIKMERKQQLMSLTTGHIE